MQKVKYGKLSSPLFLNNGNCYIIESKLPDWTITKTGETVRNRYKDKHMNLDHLNGKTFLIVDDDNFNIQLIKTMLDKLANVKVVSTDKGSEALTVLKVCGEYIDMVLLDLQMPEMKGEDVLEAIRNEMQSDIPVLIISVNGLEEQELKEKGANDFVLKPFELDDLKTKIMKYLPKEN